MKKFLIILFLIIGFVYGETVNETEPNNFYTDANNILISDTGIGNNNNVFYSRLYHYFDIDWWKFTPEQNGVLEIRTNNFNGYIIGESYDSNLNLIGSGEGENIDYFIPVKANETYYLKLILLGGDKPYKLNFKMYDINITTNERDFSLRKFYNIRGNYSIIGNTVLCYKDLSGKCIDSSLPNNNTYLSYINLLGSPYINSSKAEITDIPDNAKILWVGFYTQGDTWDSKSILINRLLKNPSYLIMPNKYNIEVYPQQIDLYQFGDVNTFSTFSEIKALESNETQIVYGKDIKGWWYGANIQTDSGWDSDLGFFGAWTMVVVYQDPNSHLKNISIFDGYKYVYTNSNNVEIPVSGFLTPKHGTVNSKVSVFVGEGDLAYTGDTISMKTENSDYVNLNINTPYENNAFYSGIDNIIRDPSLNNNYGIDIHTYNVGTTGLNIIKNGDTNATLKFYSRGDAYFPSLFVFSTDLYEPRVCYYIDEIKDLNGEIYYKDGEFVKDIDPSKEYNVSLWISNMKKSPTDEDIETADKVKVFVDYNNTQYINESTFIKNIGWEYFEHITDAKDNDIGYYENNQSVWNVGVGATSTEGGTIEPATSFTDNLHKVFSNVLVKFNIDSNTTFNLDNYLILKATLRIPTIDVDIDNAYRLPKCVDFNTTGGVYIPQTGKFAIVNNDFESNEYDSDASYNKFYTQIVNKPILLKLLKLADDQTNLETFSGVVELDLIQDPQNDTECKNNESLKYEYIYFDNEKIKNVNFIYENAMPDVRFRVRYLVDGNGNIVSDTACLQNDKTYNCIWGLLTQLATSRYGNECPTGNVQSDYCNVPCAEVCNYKRNRTQGGGDVPSDECIQCVFANYSESVCAKDNFAIRPDRFIISNIQPVYKAGDEINLTIKAVDYNGNPVSNYNETLKINGTSPTIEYNETKNGCVTGIMNGENLTFTSGIANVKLIYNEIGDLNLTVKEVNESEFAKIDSNDTAWNLREINSSSVILHILPYKFEITGNYNNAGNGFTYISNDLNMSSVLNLTIRAVNKNGGTTKNYNVACYAKPFDINISHSLPSDIHLILYKDQLGNEKNVSIGLPIVFTSLPSAYFTTSNKGVANIPVKINFQKIYNTPVNEFNFTIKDINVSDVNGTFGTSSIDQNATFRYGSIVVNNVSGYDTKELNFTAQYMFYKNNTWKLNVDHNSTDLGEINLSKSIKPSDITLSVIQKSGKNVYEGVEKIKAVTTHALPYSAKVHLSIPSWLWYHPLATKYEDPSSSNLNCLTHPCVKLTFLKSGKGWAGIGRNSAKYNEKNVTVETNLSKETNISKEGVKKLNW